MRAGNEDSRGEQRRIWSVGELAREFSGRLEREYPPLWVRGEVSDFRLYQASGHRYFTLKDREAQFSCVFWSGRAKSCATRPADGLKVEALVRLVFYGPRGRLQLDVQDLRPAGLGDLMQAFLERKERLAAEGLFDAERKQSLPPHPESIGLLTSEEGAAFRDIVKVIRRRHPAVKLLLCPSPVQGETAGSALASNLRRLWRVPGLDLIILGRGGGSFEDLFCFNSEELVRAIADCPLPVISAVGHEVDTTLSDLAADLRAPTPSAAAELAVPDDAQLLDRLEHLRVRAEQAARRALAGRSERLSLLAEHRALSEPLRRLREAGQRLDEDLSRMAEVLGARVQRLDELLPGHRRRMGLGLRRGRGEAAERLNHLPPRRLKTLLSRRLQESGGRLTEQGGRLRRLLDLRVRDAGRVLRQLEGRLARMESERLVAWAWKLGFIICTDLAGAALTRAAGISPGQQVRLRFRDGGAKARITQIEGRADEETL